MAKKQVKNIKLNANDQVKDFTIEDEHRAVIRFNKECVMSIYVNMDTLAVNLECADEKTNKIYRLAGSLEEVL